MNNNSQGFASQYQSDNIPQPTQNTICNLDWYKKHVHKMDLAVLNRHIESLNQTLHPQNTYLTPVQRADVAESIALLRSRVKVMVPNESTSVRTHDEMNGNRIAKLWPKRDGLPKHSLTLHLHFMELVADWRIHPYRKTNTFLAMNNTLAGDGRTVVDGGSERDLYDFREHFGLSGFITHGGSFVTNEIPSHWIELRNQFVSGYAHEFLDVLNQSMVRLASINDERKRAIHVDNDKVGIIPVDHFSARERMQLDHIKAARIALAESAR